MASLKPIDRLFGRIKDAGVNKSFIRQVVLPSWWDESIADSQPGYNYTLSILSAHLHIPFEALLDDSKPISCPEDATTRFKLHKNVSKDEVRWADCIGRAAARLAISATKEQFTPTPIEPLEIRKEILETASHVGLNELLDYLWGHGIPVIHVSEKPKGQKKMAGLAAKFDGRPVIVCCKNDSLNALMVFLISHEFGHIAKHLGVNDTVVDESVDRTNKNDAEEQEANDFAAMILIGSTTTYTARNSHTNITGEKLAELAKATGVRDKVDPGVVAMSFAHGKAFYPVGTKACKIIEGENADAPKLIREKMLEHLDLEKLSDEDREFLLKACGIEVLDAVPV